MNDLSSVISVNTQRISTILQNPCLSSETCDSLLTSEKVAECIQNRLVNLTPAEHREQQMGITLAWWAMWLKTGFAKIKEEQDIFLNSTHIIESLHKVQKLSKQFLKEYYPDNPPLNPLMGMPKDGLNSFLQKAVSKHTTIQQMFLCICRNLSNIDISVRAWGLHQLYKYDSLSVQNFFHQNGIQGSCHPSNAYQYPGLNKTFWKVFCAQNTIFQGKDRLALVDAISLKRSAAGGGSSIRKRMDRFLLTNQPLDLFAFFVYIYLDKNDSYKPHSMNNRLNDLADTIIALCEKVPRIRCALLYEAILGRCPEGWFAALESPWFGEKTIANDELRVNFNELEDLFFRSRHEKSMEHEADQGWIAEILGDELSLDDEEGETPLLKKPRIL